MKIMLLSVSAIWLFIAVIWMVALFMEGYLPSKLTTVIASATLSFVYFGIYKYLTDENNQP